MLIPPITTLFPYTTLFRSRELRGRGRELQDPDHYEREGHVDEGGGRRGPAEPNRPCGRDEQDRHGARCHLVVDRVRSEEHTSELQSHVNLVCRLLLEKKKE